MQWILYTSTFGGIELMIVTTGELKKLFGVSDVALHKWKLAGCPKAGRGRWNLNEVLSWRLSRDGNTGTGGEMKLRKLRADVEFREERAQRERLLRERLEETVFRREDVQEAWVERVEELTERLSEFPAVLARALVRADENEMQEIVAEHVRGFLLDMAGRGGDQE